MTFAIPLPIKTLPGGSGLPVLPSRSFETPREGRCYIPVEVDWDGSGTTFQANVQGLTTQQFSQIVMLDVDNTKCGADVVFFFPDSTDTLSVPAGSAGLFPVFTGGLGFYIAAPAALASDVTRFRILNYRQEPVGNPSPQFTTIASVQGFNQPATTALVAPGISGTLTGYSLEVAVMNPTAAAGYWSGSLVSHTGAAILDQFNIGLPASATAGFNGLVWNVSGCAIRFAGGLDLTVIGQPFGLGNVLGNVSVRFRTP